METKTSIVNSLINFNQHFESFTGEENLFIFELNKTFFCNLFPNYSCWTRWRYITTVVDVFGDS